MYYLYTVKMFALIVKTIRKLKERPFEVFDFVEQELNAKYFCSKKDLCFNYSFSVLAVFLSGSVVLNVLQRSGQITR